MPASIATRPSLFTSGRWPRPGACRVRPGQLYADELTRAEVVALETLAGIGPPGLAKDAGTARVDAATRAAFGDHPCQGLQYAGERARWVYAGEEPESMLMPGAR